MSAVPSLSDRIRALLSSGANRIALSSAARGALATVVPLIVLPLLGIGAASRLAVIGALTTSNVDMGGSYRSRLAAMLALALLGPLVALLGMQTGAHWWLAAGCIFVIALGGGLVRALGPGGASLGLNLCVAFLIGHQVGEEAPPGEELALAAGYLGGALWTVLLALVFWQIRPYRRVEQEVAAAWQGVATLVREARLAEASSPSVVGRRRREADLARQHRSAREAIETARAGLGEMRVVLQGAGTTMGNLFVLLRSAGRIDAAIVAFIEADTEVDESERRKLNDALAVLEESCRAMAGLILEGRGAFDGALMRDCLAALTGSTAHLQVLALAQALRQIDNGAEAAEALFGPKQVRTRPGLTPLSGLSARRGFEMLRAQITPKSAIFRHALRVAVVGAAATGATVWLTLPHGIWLPMSALIILQPDYGGTLTRALQRTAGTAGGAVLAGLLLATLQGGLAFEIAIAALLFGTFLVRRRHFGFAAVFMTPLIILLLGLGGPDPWADLFERIAYTVVGAVLAIGAGYVLWPIWERQRVTAQIGRTLSATATYAAAVLDALSGKPVPVQTLADLRRDAEVGAANLGAAFTRMRAEPRHRRGRLARIFVFDTYVQRFLRHAVALAAHIGETAIPAADAEALKGMLTACLADIGASLAAGRDCQPRPNFDEPLDRLRQALDRDPTKLGPSLASLLGQLVSDTTSLLAAAEMR
jgi:uncharacterized membrane protein YccC